MQTDEFTAGTEAFLSWLSEVGVRINPKMIIKDLRSEGRGRGVGESAYQLCIEHRASFLLGDSDCTYSESTSTLFPELVKLRNGTIADSDQVAVADFAEDEVVFSIPRSVALNVSNALASLSDNASKDAISKMPNWLVGPLIPRNWKIANRPQALTTTIVSEGQRPDSKWAPYLAILPRQLDSLVFWSALELAELQASTVVTKIGKTDAEQTFAEHITPLGESTTELYHRVASIIMAYAFDIPEDGEAKETDGTGDADELVSDDGEDEKTVLSMIPLADMLNADADRNNARLCSDKEELEMRTIKPIAKGEEILNDYGQLPRSDLLRRYGYVTDNYAAYDVTEISTKSIVSHLTNGSLTLANGK